MQLKEDKLNESEKRYGTAQIEIQVASVLMHAWSEVEHDLAYKPFSGQLSESEYAILDELNGLVLSGEIALERLQSAVKERISKQNSGFRNHYELSAFLYDVIKHQFPNTSNEPIMGRADILLEFLKLAELNEPKHIEGYISELDYDTEKRPISEQLVDRILATNSELSSVYQQVRIARDKKNPYNSSEENRILLGNDTNAIGFFITCWSIFERTLREVARYKGMNSRFIVTSSFLSELNIFPEEMLYQINTIRMVKNRFIHEGTLSENPSELINYGNMLLEILRFIASHSPTDENLSKIVNSNLSKIQDISVIN
ncbi:hypothetical protein [Metabacillus fastidiosus]|uniref:hypothetical protein n=1 Tax=Metabacillus fastidiosus TaxID=1458 RepID=UPI003D2E10ED